MYYFYYIKKYFLKKKGYGKQYFEMHKDLLNIVKEKIR